MREKLLLILMLTSLTLVSAAQPLADPLKAGFDPHVGAQVPLDLVLTDETGKSASLSQLLADQPAILVLGYYGCPMLCHQVQEGLLDGLASLPHSVGEGFRVLTVSIDAQETPQLAAQKREAYLQAYQRPVALGAWPFLVGDAAAVAGLQKAVGFRSAALPDQIAHPAGLVVLTAQGKVSSYLYGVRFPSKALEEALQGARGERTAPTVLQKVVLLCYQYDPTTGRYNLAIMRLIQAFALLTLATLGLAVAGWLRQERAESSEDAL